MEHATVEHFGAIGFYVRCQIDADNVYYIACATEESAREVAATLNMLDTAG